MKKNIKKIILILFLIIPTLGYSESSVFALAPFSIGEHHYPYSTAALGRGGFSMAFMDSVALNQMNYSLWAFLPQTTFSLGVSYQGLSSESAANKISSVDGNFLGGFLAVPIIKRTMAIGFGILPKSINNQGFILKDVGIGSPAEQTIKTKGTLSEVQFIASWAPLKILSIGLFGYYILGKIDDDVTIEYEDRAYQTITVSNQYRFYGKGPSFGVSAYYQMTPRLSVGGRIKFRTTMNVSAEQVSITANKTIREDQEVTFPMNFTAGVTWRPHERWAFGGDIDFIEWQSGYLFNKIPIASMNNNYRLGVGVERVPSKRRFASYVDKMNYRAGVFLGQLNFLSNGEPVNEYGFSLGLGLPIIQGSSRLDIAFQFGKRGDVVINGLSETFFRLNFSISANELWFVRDDR